jgi:glycolate oxidase FAD binding subunit
LNTTCLIDDFGPLPVARPESVAELQELVRRAAADNQAVYPLGGGTSLQLGNPPNKPGVAVDLLGLDQVIDFPARDMTITVQAGITIAKLQAMLAPENLRLPIDVLDAERATLGGILAANVSGPRRLGYGTLRDYLIGVHAVNDQGNEFKAGGRVVKNVAGYDLCKLLVGSLGTLGVITQATLKLRPRAEENALITLGCEGSAAAGLLDRLHGSRTRPVCVDLLNRSAADAIYATAKMTPPTSPWTVVVGYEGNADAVNWQVQQLVQELGAGQSLEARVGFTAGPLWDSLIARQSGSDSPVTFKASLLSSGVADFCRAANGRMQIIAHAASGIVWGHAAADIMMEQTAAMLGVWRDAAAKHRGSVIVPRCPPAWKQALNVWGPPPADAWLMREVKKQFDPRGVFNPGRFVDWI